MPLPNFTPEQPTFFGEAIPFVMKNWLQKVWRYIRNVTVVAPVQTVSFSGDFDTYFYPIDTTAGGITATLPPASDCMGKQYVFELKAGANPVAFAVTGSDTFSPAAPTNLTVLGTSSIFISNGISIWYQVAFISAAGGGGTITTQDEGVLLSATVTTLNFVGAGVTASGAGATTTVTVPAATISTQDEGGALSSTVTTLNFVGAGVTATGAGATTAVNIPGTHQVLGWGDGSDGAFTADGVAVPAWATLVGSVYTMTRPAHLTTLTVNAGITIIARYPGTCNVVLVLNGTMHVNGGNAVTSTAGTAGAVGSTYFGAGAAGGNGAVGAANGSNSAAMPNGCGAAGGAGGIDGAGHSAGLATYTDLSTIATTLGSAQLFMDCPATRVGVFFTKTGQDGLFGGGGGSGGGSSAGGVAGGGGGAAGVLLWYAKTISGTGTGVMSANGGNGANASAGVAGGGGGGGAGYLCLWTQTANYASIISVTVTGGIGGTGLGTGATGANGGTGRLNVFVTI